MISSVLVAVGLLYGEAANPSYEQYMKDYNGGGGKGGSQSQSQSGDYQQYMKKYADGNQKGEYSNYYHKYMKQYVGKKDEYQQYMKKYAQGSQGGHASQGGSKQGDYEQYMKKYAGSHSQSGDYQEYMKKYAAKNGDYQQYMKKYTGGHGSKASSSEMELMEKPPKTSDDSSVGSELSLAATKASTSASANSNYQKYMQQYAGDSGSYKKYMNQYAGKYADSYEKYMDYQKYMKRYKNQHNAQVRSAHDAQNKSQLDTWYKGASQSVKWYVPDEDSKYAQHDIDKTYETRLSELDNVDTVDTTTAGGPFEATAEGLQEKAHSAKAANTFLAQTLHGAKASEVASNLQLVASQVQSDPATCSVMALLGVAFACLVFFAMRRRRSIQTPERLLG